MLMMQGLKGRQRALRAKGTLRAAGVILDCVSLIALNSEKNLFTLLNFVLFAVFLRNIYIFA